MKFIKTPVKGMCDMLPADMRLREHIPLARYYANNKEKLPTPFKALQIGNVWRADNPQKGRFRQFTQCDIDILGDDTNLAEIELIAATSDMLSQIFSEVGITDFTIHINDRQILRAAALQRLLVLCLFHWISTTRLALRAFAGN